LSKYTTYAQVNESNGEHNKTNVVDEESAYKQEGVESIWPENTIVLALESTPKSVSALYLYLLILTIYARFFLLGMQGFIGVFSNTFLFLTDVIQFFETLYSL
jgi:hypothetical protein